MIVVILLSVAIILVGIETIRLGTKVYVQQGLIDMLLIDRKNFYEHMSKEEHVE